MIIAGFGFRQNASVDSLLSAFARAQNNNLIDALATAEDKAQSPVFIAFSEAICLPVHGIKPDALRQMQTLTQSAAALAARGTGSVAEAAALAAAGPGATLLAAREISDDNRATCALAQGTPT